MRVHALPFLVLVLPLGFACNGESTSTSEKPTETEATAAKEPSARPAKKRRPMPSKWKIDYTGDLSGSIEGEIMTTAGGDAVTVIGAAMQADGKASAPQRMMAMIFAKGDLNAARTQTSVTLADETRCVEAHSATGEVSRANVTDREPKTFRATIEGELACGDKRDKIIKYKGVLNRKP